MERFITMRHGHGYFLGKEAIMDIKEAYKVMQEASGIKVGDTVKVLRAAKDNEMGWKSHPLGQTLKKYGEIIGRPVVVEENTGSMGFKIEGNWYPFFVLEKIASAPEKSEIDKVIDGLDFGCKQEAVRKVVHAIIAECKGGR